MSTVFVTMDGRAFTVKPRHVDGRVVVEVPPGRLTHDDLGEMFHMLVPSGMSLDLRVKEG